VVLGASPDTPAKQAKFKRSQDLPFTLLADADHKVAEAFGVWGEKSFMGKKFMGVSRTTFLIDPEGTVAHVFEKVKPVGHAAEVSETLEELKAPR
jgi:peroxiredoxin Q/BCP